MHFAVVSLALIAHPSAAEAFQADRPECVIVLRSTYTSRGYPIGSRRVRQILLPICIDGEDGRGMLGFDPNHCQLNEFGDRTRCTEMGGAWRWVSLRRRDTLDPTGQGRCVYELSNHRLDGEVTLVAPADQAQPYRLIFDAEDGKQVISLAPVPETDTRPHYPWPTSEPEKVGDGLTLRAVFVDRNQAVINGRAITLGDVFRVGDIEYRLHSIEDRSVVLRARVLEGRDRSNDSESTVRFDLPRSCALGPEPVPD
jgi:hypothetical protein